MGEKKLLNNPRLNERKQPRNICGLLNNMEKLIYFLNSFLRIGLFVNIIATLSVIIQKFKNII